MGTDLESVIEDLRKLKEHINYLSVCLGKMDDGPKWDLALGYIEDLLIMEYGKK